MLASKNRLTKKQDYEKVRANGKFVSSKFFTISFVKRIKQDAEPRFGFIVSKKISGKAVVRNKIKRILRETVRGKLKDIKTGVDFVIIVKPGIVHAGHDTIESELEKCLSEF